jgi:Tfp pilus assembly protein PilW
MGRPLKKDINGVNVIGTYGTNSADSSAGVVVRFYDASLRTDGVIIKQRGSKSFQVCRIGDIGTTANYTTAVLKNGTPSVYGEMQIIAYLTGGADASAVNVAKITKKIITDFSGNRYTWSMTNFADSTADQIELTAL